MNFLKKIILVLIFLFPISNSFGESITHNQTVTVSEFQDDGGGLVAGIEFNNDGTKMFTTYANKANDEGESIHQKHVVAEYNLSTPYDISTRVYAGSSERCVLTGIQAQTVYDLEFSSDGMHLFVVTRDAIERVHTLWLMKASLSGCSCCCRCPAAFRTMLKI